MYLIDFADLTYTVLPVNYISSWKKYQMIIKIKKRNPKFENSMTKNYIYLFYSTKAKNLSFETTKYINIRNSHNR